MAKSQFSRLADLPRPKLQALIDRAQKALATLRDREIRALVEGIRAQAQELGVEISELVAHLSAEPARRRRRAAASSPAAPPRRRRTSSAKGKKVKPWFRDSAGHTRSGRGQVARFVREHVVAGGKLAELLVDKSKAAEAKRIEGKLKGGRARESQRRRARSGESSESARLPITPRRV